MHNALLIKDGKIERVFVLTLADMQKAVDGYIERAFTLPGSNPEAPERVVDAYVDEEGLYNKPDWSVAVGGDIVPGGYAYKGPMLICGSNEDTGDRRDLTEAEMSGFSITDGPDMIAVQGQMLYLPVLSYNPAAVKGSLFE